MSEAASKLATTLGFEFSQPSRKVLARRSRTRSLIEWVVVIVGAVAVAMLIKAFVVQAFYIPSGSMEPTLDIQDRVLVNKLSYKMHGVNRGDIVVFERVEESSDEHIKDLIKRVIALPGEKLVIEGGSVYVNDHKLVEPYLPADSITSTQSSPYKCTVTEPCIVPEASVWVMGDNRGNSRDSRWFGPVPKSKIVGRAAVRVWPLGRIGSL